MEKKLKSISSKSKNPFDYDDDYSNPVRDELKWFVKGYFYYVLYFQFLTLELFLKKIS